MSAMPTPATPTTASSSLGRPSATIRRKGAQIRQRLTDAILPSQTRKVITDGLALGYRYDPRPIVWPNGTPAPKTP